MYIFDMHQVIHDSHLHRNTSNNVHDLMCIFGMKKAIIYNKYYNIMKRLRHSTSVGLQTQISRYVYQFNVFYR